MTDFNKAEEAALNPIQPVSDDFSTDGYLPEFAKVDHQHPLSESLRAAIFNAGVGTYVRKIGDTMSGDLNFVSGVSLKLDSTFNNRIYYFSSPSGTPWMIGPRLIGETGFSHYCVSQGADVLGHRGGGAGGYFWVASKALIGKTPDDAAMYQALNVNGNIAIVAANAGINWYGIGGGTPGIWSQDVTWVRAAPNFYTNGICGGQGGISGGGAGGGMGGYTSGYFPGNIGVGIVYTTNCYISGASGYGVLGVRRDQGTDHTWSAQQITLQDQGGANSQCGMSMWCSPYGVAPLVRCFGQFGERMDFINSANTAYIYIGAGSFNVGSSEKIKEEIEEQSDEEVLRIASSLKAHRFRMKVKPTTLRPSEKFKAANAKWIAKGKEPLEMKPEHMEHHNHDCTVDFCAGTHAVDDPCIMLQNDTPRYGLIAEHVHAVAPEITNLDLNFEPESYDISQTSSLALAGVGALNRKIDGLIERLERLEK